MANPAPTDDQDETVTTASGKQVVLPPPPGQSSPLYNAEPADSKGDDSPYTTDFLKRFDPAKTDTLNKGLADIERQRGQAEQSQFGSLNRKMEQDRAQMEKAFTAESASADSIPPPWNADKEQRERVRSPIEDFGSIGSIFGIIASQFTKTPLTSAMNAAAAAMNATREHDEEGYKTAYDAWKENTALALKRFGMERELYEDANKFIETDISQWKVKQLQIAAQFDNKKAIAMLDAGMNGELMDLQAKQVDMAAKLQKIMGDQEVVDDRRQVLSAGMKAYDQQNPYKDPQKPTPKEIYNRAMARLDLLRETAEGKTQWQVDELNRFRTDYMMQNGHAPSDQEVTQHMMAIIQSGKAGGGAPTKEKDVQQRLDAWLAEQKTAGRRPSQAEINEKHDEIRTTVANASQPTMTPTNRNKTEGEVVQYDQAIDAIDASIHTLETYRGAAGLAGRATRGAEIVGNIFGVGHDSARSMLESNIEFLRAGTRKLLFDQSGRPLAQDSGDIQDQTGTLGFGATVDNSLARLRKLKERYNELRGSKNQQLKGNWTPDRTERERASTVGGDSTKSTWQDEAIPVTPRVDVGQPTSP